jgi:hypothetical protein
MWRKTRTMLALPTFMKRNKELLLIIPYFGSNFSDFSNLLMQQLTLVVQVPALCMTARRRQVSLLPTQGW